MSDPKLHLLRPFAKWRIKPHTVDQAERYVNEVYGAGYGVFYTVSSRRPKRAAELEGGSVYFVRSGFTVFRMPLVEIEVRRSGVCIAMRPKLIRVEPRKVGMVRGWRYLAAADAPPDIPSDLLRVPRHLRRQADRAFDEAMLIADLQR